MILDTNFAIDFLNGKKDAVSRMKSLNKEHAITSVTIFEIWSGIISLSKGDVNKSKTKEFFSSQIVYNLNGESAEQAGKIHGDLVKKGMEIEVADCMIAGIAIKNNLPILTKDEHFNRIEGLKIESY